MARYDISPQGVESLRHLASDLRKYADGISYSGTRLKRKLNAYMDDLGVFGTEIYETVLRIDGLVEDRKEGVYALSDKARKMADDIEAILPRENNIGPQDTGHSSGEQTRGGKESENGQGPASAYGLLENTAKIGRLSYNEPEWYDMQPAEEDIVSFISGDDRTAGSCSSLAFAYIANKAGLKVKDMRGGKSQDIFSRRNVISLVCHFSGMEEASVIQTENDDFAAAGKLLQKMKAGREYYLAVGGHAAMVKLIDGEPHYLELQSPNPSEIGWHTLTRDTLGWRFGCREKYILPRSGFLIDAESLGNCTEFQQMMGYINTEEGESGWQRKRTRTRR